jgi:hypothetical protein
MHHSTLTTIFQDIYLYRAWATAQEARGPHAISSFKYRVMRARMLLHIPYAQNKMQPLVQKASRYGLKRYRPLILFARVCAVYGGFQHHTFLTRTYHKLNTDGLSLRLLQGISAYWMTANQTSPIFPQMESSLESLKMASSSQIGKSSHRRWNSSPLCPEEGGECKEGSPVIFFLTSLVKKTRDHQNAIS